MFTFTNGKAHEQYVVPNGQYVIVNSKFISSDGFIRKYANKLICPLTKGDIVMVMSDVPNGKAMSKCFLIDKNNTYTLNQRICSLSNMDTPLFFLYQINRNKYFMKFDDGVSQTNLKKEDVLNCPIYSTIKDEREKISKFISILDKRIQKQQKLMDSLKSYKRGLENIVFSPKYSTIISVFDMLTECVERSTINNQYPIISSTKQGLFMQSEYFNKQAASINTVGYKILKIGQIVFSPQNLWMGNINYNNKFEIGIVSPSYKVYKVNSNYDSLYVGYLLKSNHAIKEYILASEQGASIVRRNLDMQLFGEIKFSVPDITRQRKFSHLLNEVDLLIQKYSSELTLLDKTKVYLLQQLFI